MLIKKNNIVIQNDSNDLNFAEPQLYYVTDDGQGWRGKCCVRWRNMQPTTLAHSAHSCALTCRQTTQGSPRVLIYSHLFTSALTIRTRTDTHRHTCTHNHMLTYSLTPSGEWVCLFQVVDYLLLGIYPMLPLIRIKADSRCIKNFFVLFCFSYRTNSLSAFEWNQRLKPKSEEKGRKQHNFKSCFQTPKDKDHF